MFYRGGILTGPVVGLALTATDFRLTCLAATAVFAVRTVLQLRSLPQRGDRTADPDRLPVLAQWRKIAGNRWFILFSLVMIGSCVLSFQVYLALPLEAHRIATNDTSGTALTATLFAVSGGVAVAGQLKIHGRARGLATLLALGTAAVFPFEMDTIVRLSGDDLVATHYGFYNTIVGTGILAENLFTGTVFDLANKAGWPEIPWLGPTALGAACAWGVRTLNHDRRLEAVPTVR
ncbi:hypothetical protein [Amycolatopsis anabasis]|uniref:hypothetical protein n=1 Tax=Amycolatopsis anabasis TaxID=1840409 RepID=UPI00131A9EFD